MKRLILAIFVLTPYLAYSKAAFSPPLAVQLDSLSAQGVIEAFLVIKNRASIGLLKAAIPDATRQKLHSEVVTTLKENARSVQADILSFLAAEKAAGRVFDYKSYWIDNYVFVRTTKSELLLLSERKEVAEVYENPQLELVEPVVESLAVIQPAPSTLTISGRAEKNLIAIGCRQVWKRGLTGKGRLICTLDTGIDGNHRAFRNRWRGRRPGVTHDQAWFDPVSSSPAPHIYFNNPNHGTHVLGIACGLDTSRTIVGSDTTLFVDTIGVAPEADWISAAVIDNGASGATILDALQWAADPDGDPNTVEDVPDAVNNSWAYRTFGAGNNLTCNSFFWQAIDNLEAAGAVAVFAAGNSRLGETRPSRSIGNPADRGTSPFSDFAVGNFQLDSLRTDPANPDSVTAFFGKIHFLSLIGPTECGPDSLKPDISAPGTAIWSSVPGNRDTFMTGTSMAAPHIAGAVAILRQYNPNATVDTIKWALAQSASDIGPPAAPAGPDTLSGFGLINIPKALELLSPNQGIHIYVKKDRIADSSGNAPYSGGTFNIYLNLTNNGVDTAASLFGKLSPADAKSILLTDSAFFGDLPPGDTASNTGQLFKVRLAPGLASGEQFHLILNLSGGNGFSQALNLTFTVGEKLFKTIYHHQNGNIEFTVSNFGQYGFEAGSIELRSLPGLQEGLGLERKTEPKVSRLFEASFMAGINDSSVSNTASNEFCCFPLVPAVPDADFAVHPGGNLQAAEPGLSGGWESFSIFDDRLAKYPLGLVISQKSYSFDSAGQDNFALLEFTLQNQSGGVLDNLHAGLFFDFDFWSSLGAYIGDKVGFNRNFDLGYQFNEAAPAYRGIASADTGKLSTFKAVQIFPTVGDGFTLAEKWQYLTSGFTDTAITTVANDAMLAAKGPFTLSPGESVKVAFAIAAAKTLDSLKAYTQAAQKIYRIITSARGDLNGDHLFTSADIVLHLNCVFLSLGNCPLNQLDLNCDGLATIEDTVILLNRVFLGALPPCP